MSAQPITQPAPPMWFTGCADVAHWDADVIRRQGRTLTDALKDAKSDGLALLLIKCTEGGDGPASGVPYVDPAFADWSNACAAAGVERGFYAVGTDSSDGVNQAAFFDRVLRRYGFDPATSLCALDREPNNPPMSPLHAEQFVTAWRAMTKRWPLYYRNESAYVWDVQNSASPSLVECPLWLAKYGEYHSTPAFDLWQYQGAESDANECPSDSVTFPRHFAGLGHVDRSAYRGTREELLAALATVGT